MNFINPSAWAANAPSCDMIPGSRSSETRPFHFVFSNSAHESCSGRFWIRLWERGWDTRKVPNGSYTLKLTVEDTVGRSASKTLRLRVAN